MVGFSWFLTRSSEQVQAWPVHQTRPNRGVGLRRLGLWPRRHRRPKPLLHKVDRPTRRAGGLSHCQNGRLDAQAVSLTAKWQTRRAQFSSGLSADCSFTSPFSALVASLFHLLFLGARRLSMKPTDTQAQLLPWQIHHCLSGARSPPSRLLTHTQPVLFSRSRHTGPRSPTFSSRRSLAQATPSQSTGWGLYP